MVKYRIIEGTEGSVWKYTVQKKSLFFWKTIFETDVIDRALARYNNPNGKVIYER